MGLLLVYIFKSGLCLAAFYLFYRLLLSKETFHSFNRRALLGVLVLSASIPLVNVSLGTPAEINQTLLSIEEWLMMSEGGASEALMDKADSGFRSWGLMGCLYVVGVLFLLGQQVYSFGRMLFLLRRCQEKTGVEGVRLYVHQEKISPFSWMRWVVMSEQDWLENGEVILAHESAHVRLRHSWDLLGADICVLLQWFNPAAWLLRQELQQVHEYEADESVICHGVNATEYQLLLIKKAVGTRLYSMANSFNHSSLKKRITMMIKKKSNPWARAKYLYVLPLATVAITVFARPEVSNKFDEISEVKVSDFTSIAKADEAKNVKKMSEAPAVDRGESLRKEVGREKVVYPNIEEDPEYPGGMPNLMRFVSNMVEYPKDAAEKGVQGRVVLEFIVEKDGTITDVKVMRGIHQSLDAEAVRVISLMPKWIPGKHCGKAVRKRFILPVSFKLADASDVENGWKGKKALALYGEKGKNGVSTLS